MASSSFRPACQLAAQAYQSPAPASSDAPNSRQLLVRLRINSGLGVPPRSNCTADLVSPSKSPAKLCFLMFWPGPCLDWPDRTAGCVRLGPEFNKQRFRRACGLHASFLLLHRFFLRHPSDLCDACRAPEPLAKHPQASIDKLSDLGRGAFDGGTEALGGPFGPPKPTPSARQLAMPALLCQHPPNTRTLRGSEHICYILQQTQQLSNPMPCADDVPASPSLTAVSKKSMSLCSPTLKPSTVKPQTLNLP